MEYTLHLNNQVLGFFSYILNDLGFRCNAV